MSKKPVDNPVVIPFAENLLDVLPKNYVGNLGDLPKEQQEAISEDNRRWYLATVMFEPRKNAKGLDRERAHKRIRDGLAVMQPDAYREDMRRRLNTIMRNSK